jgi:hypothetical protein
MMSNGTCRGLLLELSYGHPFVFRENPSLDLRLCTKIDINGPIWFWEVGVSDLVQKRVANSFLFFAIWRFQEMVPVFTNGIIFVG